MKTNLKNALLCGVVAVSGMFLFSSCKDDGYRDMAIKTTQEGTFTITQEEKVEIPFRLEYFDPAVTKLTVTSSDPEFTVTTGTLSNTGNCSVFVQAPKYILAPVNFQVTVNAEDTMDKRTAQLELQGEGKVTLDIVQLTSDANSFIVAPGSFTYFEPAKGNSGEAVDFDAANLVWQDENGLVDDLFVKNGRIYVSLKSGAEGNAVIAATKADAVQWSWNFWVTDYDPEASTFTYEGANGTYVMMDRNLGALSNASGTDKVNGNFYQWGRKDAFPGSTYEASLKTVYDMEGNEIEKTIEKVTEAMNIDNGIAHPFTHYAGVGGGNYSWVTANFSAADKDVIKDLWGAASKTKSTYDPCPSGWKVAPADAIGFYRDADAKREKVYNGDAVNANFLGWNITVGESSSFFPSQGEVQSAGGNYTSGVGTTWPCGKLWSASADNMSTSSYFRAYGANVSPSSCSCYYFAFGYELPVRCVKE